MLRRSVGLVFIFLAAVHAPAATRAQVWPAKPVRIVVPFAPGGAIDVMARFLAAGMQASLKTPVIVENRAGVGGNLGADYVAKQPADGYTILYNTNGQAISPATYKSLPFDPFRDFTPVSQLFASNLLLVGAPKLPATNLQEFIALAKAKPGVLNYGSSGIGNPLHLTMELLKLKAGIDIQMVPYRGDGEIINALVGGNIDAAIIPLVSGREPVLSGQLKGLGLTAARRAPDFNVLPFAEQGMPDFDAGGWQGLFVAAATPGEVVTRIQQEAKKAFDTPEMQKRVDNFGLINVFSTSPEFAAFYRVDVENFRRIVRDAKIPLQE